MKSMTTHMVLYPHPFQNTVQRHVDTTDGYLRLSIDSFTGLAFEHLYSEHDELILDDLHLRGIDVFAAGVSEWKSMGRSEISIGWSWCVDEGGRLKLAPEPVRTNLMLADSHGCDLGQRLTSDFLQNWLHTFSWQSAVVASLNLRLPTC